MSKVPSMLSRLVNPSQLATLWNVLKNVPGGGAVMGRLIGQMAPYTGTIRPEIVALEPGHATVRMKDRRAVRNHLKSVHAIALMNLGEVATGTAMLASVPPGARAIITHLGMDYLKKARGTITGDCRCAIPSSLERREYQLEAALTNEQGEVVATAHARWMVGPA